MKEEIIKLILAIFSYALIFYAVHIGRDEDDKLKPFSLKWWTATVLVIIGANIFKYLF